MIHQHRHIVTLVYVIAHLQNLRRERRGIIPQEIEDSVLAVIEPCAPKFDGAENFHALALSGYGDFRRPSDAAPGGVQGRVLPETGFVGEEEGTVLRTGFFLRAG